MSNPQTTKADMQWPTLIHKVYGAMFFKWPVYNGFWFRLRDWYYGNYFIASFGWFAFKMGVGEYD